MKSRISFGRKAEVNVTDAMTFTLTDDDKPDDPPALVVAFDVPTREVVLALKQIAVQVEDGLTAMESVKSRP